MRLYEVSFPCHSLWIRSGARKRMFEHVYGFQTTDKRKARGVARKIRKHTGNRYRPTITIKG